MSCGRPSRLMKPVLQQSAQRVHSSAGCHMGQWLLPSSLSAQAAGLLGELFTLRHQLNCRICSTHSSGSESGDFVFEMYAACRPGFACR